MLTSGGDQVYPRGLPVGTIESIAPDPDHQPYTAIVVRPAVDLNRVEEVLVITGTQPDLPADAQQDLAAAEAQHAADLSAERLPSIHDDEPPGTPSVNGAAPATPGNARRVHHAARCRASRTRCPRSIPTATPAGQLPRPRI